MKIKYTKFSIILEVLAAIILIGTFGFLLIKWPDIPDKIPMHYNAAGEVNRIGSKSELLIMPFVSLFVYALITVLTFFPSIWNVPVNVTGENREKVYGYVKSMVILLKAEVLAVFFYISYMIANVQQSLSGLLLPITLVAVFVTIAGFLIAVFKATKKEI